MATIPKSFAINGLNFSFSALGGTTRPSEDPLTILFSHLLEL